MSSKPRGLTMNIIVDKIIDQIIYSQKSSSLEELIKKRNIVLIRSAKEEVLNNLLSYLYSIKYSGNIYILGRKNDKNIITNFMGLNIFVYEINEDEKYTWKNCGKIIESLNADAICFLYQKIVSIDHDNLFEIINHVDYDNYAISKQLKIIKFLDINRYVEGRRIYEELCDWFYEVGDR